MTDRVSGIVKAVCLRVEDELTQQLNALTTEHERALDEALREAAKACEQQAQEAEARWSGRIAEVEAQAEQGAAAAVVAARAEYEKARMDARSTETSARLRLSKELDRAGTLSGVLDALTEAAATEAGAALLVSKRGILEHWAPAGLGPSSVSPEWTLAAESAVREREPHRRGDVLAVPVLLDDTAVAVLVGLEPPGDRSTLEPMAIAGSTRLTAVTASRLIQAERWVGGTSPAETWRISGPADFPSEGL